MVQFILNNEDMNADVTYGSTVLDFIRYHQNLKGTKIGCREGDCGACTVLIGDYDQGNVLYRSATSCLMPLSNAHGKHIVSVEGLNLDDLNQVQKSIVENGGTQCGFCTVGFVVSLCGFCLSDKTKDLPSAIGSIDGNICRCTGYKSLERAAADVVNKLHAEDAVDLHQLVNHGFIPRYFEGIPQRLSKLHTSLPEISNGQDNGNGKVKVGGGTDLYVQRAETLAHSELHSLKHNGKTGSWSSGDKIHFGSTSTARDLRFSIEVSELVPGIKDFMKLVSSTQIRSMGTISGNFMNASPIGDLTIFFLAWDANLIIEGAGNSRELRLKDLYQGYKQLNMEPGEIIKEMTIDIPQNGHYFNFEKVSKRTHLDIASVNSACYIEFKDGAIQAARLSAGGVAPIPLFLAQTSEFLEGGNISTARLREANEIMQSEISPISDVRGSADYKRALCRQLLYAHFLELFPDQLPPEELLC